MPMTFLDRLIPSRAYANAVQASLAVATGNAAAMPRQVGIQSPMSDQSALQAVVWADLTGQEAVILTRDAVMEIPAAARQRHLIVGTMARCPLRVMRGAEQVDTTATSHWSSRTDGIMSPYHRMLWTGDDLLFHGWSLWRADRGSEGQLLNAGRIPTERWELDHVDRILVDGDYVSDEEVILIPGPHEGILNFGRKALKRTMDNLNAAANAAQNPSAYLELHYIGDDPVPDAAVDKHIERWAKARRGENGGVAWTNKLIELKEHGTHEAHLLIEGRNADAVDVSRMVSSPAAMADATASGASLTYETTEGRGLQFLDYGAGLYMDSVAARLSMDDVVPKGQRVAFDSSAATTFTPTGAPTDD